MNAIVNNAEMVLSTKPDYDFPGLIKRGVYFGMPDHEYHAEPSLSASGIKKILVSPMDYWATSWMNQTRQDERTSDAMDLGTAYHKRILEGRAAFQANYAAAIDPDDYPDAIRTVDDLKSALDVLAVPYKSTLKKPDLIQLLLDKDPDAPIWDNIISSHARAHDGLDFLPAKQIERIELAAAMIERHPQLGKAFTGGYPEVSVFWIDAESNLPMKARIDYLKIALISDLKTFTNPQEMPIDRAIYRAMASRKYHVQSVVYSWAVEAISGFIRTGNVHGEVDKDWLAKFDAFKGERPFLFVFQQTGNAPIARGYILPRQSVWGVGETQARSAIVTFENCWKTFEADPWIDLSNIQSFDDTGFPVYMSEG